MTTRDRVPTVREADLQKMRDVVAPWRLSGYGWEDLWIMFFLYLPPPSISREDVRRFVIPRLEKAK